MKKRHRAATIAPPLLLAIGVGLFAGKLFAQDQIMLRVACEGPSLNAEITLNGVFKGECPIDVSVMAGQIKLRAVKKVGRTREAVYEQDIRMAAGTVKRVIVELGEPVPTAEGLVIEQQQRERAQAEALRQDEARKKAAQEAKAAELADIRQKIERRMSEANDALERVLLSWREKHPSGIADCVDCPPAIKRIGVRPRTMSHEWPEISDNQTLTWFKETVDELNSDLADGGTSFRPPALSAPLPCGSAAASIRSLVGMADLVDLPVNEMMAGYLALSGGAYQHRGVKIWPQLATCVDGKLDGPLDVWVFGIRLSSYSVSIVATPILTRVAVLMQAGKPTGEVRTSRREGNNLIQPAVVSETMAYSRQIYDSDGLYRSWGIIQPHYEDPTMKDSVVPHTTIAQRVGGQRMETSTYEGARLSVRSHTKAGLNHGLMTLYGYTKKGGFLAPDMVIPTTTQCFQNGRTAQLNPCPAN